MLEFMDFDFLSRHHSSILLLALRLRYQFDFNHEYFPLIELLELVHDEGCLLILNRIDLSFSIGAISIIIGLPFSQSEPND